MKNIIILVAMLFVNQGLAIEFKSYVIDGKTVYSNVPPKCQKDGVLTCSDSHPVLNDKDRVANKPRISERSGLIPMADQSNYNFKKKEDSGIESVIKRIKIQAIKDFPGDYVTQKYVIDSQTANYYQVKQYQNDKIPAKELKKIKAAAKKDFPDDYTTQIYVINSQVKAYLSIR